MAQPMAPAFLCVSRLVQLGAAEEARAALEARRLQETERRARALSTQRGPERGLLAQGGARIPRAEISRE